MSKLTSAGMGTRAAHVESAQPCLCKVRLGTQFPPGVREGTGLSVAAPVRKHFWTHPGSFQSIRANLPRASPLWGT
eukprot:959867-Amphidinium_carterae.1